MDEEQTMRRRGFLAASGVGVLAGCMGGATRALGLATSTAVSPASPSPAGNPNAAPGVPTNEQLVTTAIERLDGLAQDIIRKTGIPGMAVAVVHKGKTAFAKGYGVRKVGAPDRVDTDTVFQLASVSKPIGATVVAKEVGAGRVTWDDKITANLPNFALSDPYVNQNVSIADMYAHRSGLPKVDLVEDIGYDQSEVFARMKYLPLGLFRVDFNYTNYGITVGANAVAAAAGIDWAALSERNIYKPLGMTNTSSNFSDFQANPNHAAGHVKVNGDGYQPKYVRQPDAQTPAAGVSSSVSDVAIWLSMLLSGGKSADGTQVVDAKALLAALSPRIRLTTAGHEALAQVDVRPTFYGYGFEISSDASGRVRLEHSGGFAEGAGTRILAIPNLDVGIVVLTNAAGNGTAEALANEFADFAEYGGIRADWLCGFQKVLAAGLTDPVGSLVGTPSPANPAPAAPNAAYLGTYKNDYIGPVTVSETGGGLVLTVGPKNMQFPLTHWDGQLFTMVPTGENAPNGSISKVIFALNGDNASAVTVEFFDADGLGTLRR
jgi:CubicO group peptidase (beta-lactamase class C family)